MKRRFTMPWARSTAAFHSLKTKPSFSRSVFADHRNEQLDVPLDTAQVPAPTGHPDVADSRRTTRPAEPGDGFGQPPRCVAILAHVADEDRRWALWRSRPWIFLRGSSRRSAGHFEDSSSQRLCNFSANAVGSVPSCWTIFSGHHSDKNDNNGDFAEQRDEEELLVVELERARIAGNPHQVSADPVRNVVADEQRRPALQRSGKPLGKLEASLSNAHNHSRRSSSW